MRHAFTIATLLLILACAAGCDASTDDATTYPSPAPGDTPLESELATGAVPIPVGSHPRLGPSIVPTQHIGPDTPFQFMRLSFSGEPLDEYWVGYPTGETVWKVDGTIVDVRELESMLQLNAPSSFDVVVREPGTLGDVNVIIAPQ
jgi:hypothetical protein